MIDNLLLNKIKDKDTINYIKDILNNKKIANKEQTQAIKRFIKDLKSNKYDFKNDDPLFVINLIEKTLVHISGEDMQGIPLNGKPLILSPWQKFIVFNLVGFYFKNSNERRFKEAFIYIPRKNGKTTFVAALAWALAILNYKSNSKVYIVSATLKQALQSFSFLKSNVIKMNEEINFIIKDNIHDHTIQRDFKNGSICIEALSGNDKYHDGLNSNIQICDELHAYKNANIYTVIKDSGKAYSNKLCIGISTAGTNPYGFCAQRLKYCKGILDELYSDDSYFVFICKADNEDLYDDKNEIIKANPNINISIKLDDLLKDATQARNDPQQKNLFLQKSLNIFTNSSDAYFNVDEFMASNDKYNYRLEELSKLPIKWYGGADLSKMHDLTAACLYGEYNGVDIAITHAFYPRKRALLMAQEYNIPFFEWEEENNLTMSNSDIVNYSDIINWFINMRDKGFKIKQVGFDRKFALEFYNIMKKKGFKMYNEPQLYILKSQGFRRIEMKVKNKEFYYLNNHAYEYCVSNVKAIEKVDDAIQYEKISPNDKIDLFDASVFACMRMLNDNKKEQSYKNFYGIVD